MKCSFCEEKAIYYDYEYAYCKKHFIEKFEEKVLNTIEKYKLIKEGEKVGVAVSGGKDSIALLYFLNKYKEELNIDVVGIHIDEGIEGYRNILTKHLLNFAKEHDIKVYIYRFSDYFGMELDRAIKLENKLKPCTICGVWRRWLMWKAAKDLRLDKLATAHNLNDEVQTIIMNIFEGNIKDIAKGGPKVGILEGDFIPRIKPFYFVTEKETMIYALLNNINPPWTECPYIINQLRDEVRKWLYKIENKYPGFHKNFLEKFTLVLNNIKEDYRKKEKIDLKPCIYCNYPTTRNICRACEIKFIIQEKSQ